MPLDFADAEPDPKLDDLTVFLGASIPNPERWPGEFDPLEITDAVVAFARVFLSAGVRIVTAAHPTIAPLLLYVASEIRHETQDQVVVYQSMLFEGLMPPETLRLEREGIGSLLLTPAVPGDSPRFGEWDASLALMRESMFRETEPAAAAFVGGMEGIPDEYALFTELSPGKPRYPIGRPGGEARALAEVSDSPIRSRLVEEDVYPALWRSVLEDLRTRHG